MYDAVPESNRLIDVIGKEIHSQLADKGVATFPLMIERIG